MKKLKKKFKKIVPILLALMICYLPFGGFKAFAYDGGLLQGKLPSGSGSGSNFSNITDGDLGSYGQISAGSSITYSFSSPTDVKHIYINVQYISPSSFYVKFLNSSGSQIGSIFSASTGVANTDVSYLGVSSVVITNPNSSSANLSEFDLYSVSGVPSSSISHTDLSSLTVSSLSNTSVNVSWSAPSDLTNVKSFKVYRNGSLISSPVKTVSSFSDSGLSEGATYTYKVTVLYSDGFETSGLTKSITTGISHNEVSNLSGTVAYNTASLSWSIPNSQFLTGFKIYRDNQLIHTTNGIENTFNDSGLKEGTQYSYKVTSIYSDGFETTGVMSNVTTNTKPHDEVTSLNANTTYNTATLSWTIPNNPYLVGFNVYKNGSLVTKLGKTVSYYQDTNLNESAAYTYKITALYDDDFETNGVTTVATTTTKAHDEITNLKAQVTYNSTSLSWTIPDNQFLVGFNVYRDNQLIKSLDPTVNSYEDTGLNQGTTYNYKIVSVYDDSFVTPGATIGVTMVKISHDEATNLNATMTYNATKLVWSIPNNQYLVGFNIYRDDKLIKTLDTVENTYEDDGLDEVTSYKYTITALYVDGFETTGISNTFTTLASTIAKPISDVSAKAVSYKQVNLSWNLPDQKTFHHVNIYRAVKPKQQSFFSGLLGSVVFADTAPKEIFETNGTYFNDLTVEPNTNYEYTLTSETTSGNVSDPITVSAETPQEPTPVYTPSGNYSVGSNGDYIFKWSTPTTGTVQILVGGKEYTTTNAADQQITIPSSAMKTTIWGDPDVSMIPIGEFGTTGKEYSVGGSSIKDNFKLPFGNSEVLKTSLDLLALFGPLILLVLTFAFYKPLRDFLKRILTKRKEQQH
ncbi:MAG: hypothetical protein Q8934_15565 [Bacillota bacterium]|nr:hypothetical protein [Bacillota bacterium]